VDSTKHLWLLQVVEANDVHDGWADKVHRVAYPYTGAATGFHIPGKDVNEGVAELSDGRFLSCVYAERQAIDMYYLDPSSGAFTLIKELPDPTSFTPGLMEPAGRTVWVGRDWTGNSYAQHLVEDSFIATEVNTSEARIDVTSVNSTSNVSAPLVNTDLIQPYPNSTGISIAGVRWPIAADDAASKEYVDSMPFMQSGSHSFPANADTTQSTYIEFPEPFDST